MLYEVITGKKGIQFDVVPERLRGELARFDIHDKSGIGSCSGACAA